MNLLELNFYYLMIQQSFFEDKKNFIKVMSHDLLVEISQHVLAL